VYDGAADRYALDSEMADKLRKSNPEAFRNILKRMLEVSALLFGVTRSKTGGSVDVRRECTEGVGAVKRERSCIFLIELIAVHGLNHHLNISHASHSYSHSHSHFHSYSYSHSPGKRKRVLVTQ
jgi:CobN/Magnesium Chelatase